MNTNELKQIAELLDKRLNPIDQKLDGLQKDIRVAKKDLAETRNDVKVLISYFDREYVNLRKRIEAIEERLGITQAQ